MKVLAVTSEPVSADALRSALGEEAADAEVMVVAPALDESRIRFLASDNDQAIARADEVQAETVERLGEDGVDATGDTGEADPLLAIQDALATFPAEQIVIFTHPEGDRTWAESDLVEQARERFSVPVRHMDVQGPSGG